VCQRACKLAIRQHIADASAGAPESERCTTITLAHFEEAFEKARPTTPTLPPTSPPQPTPAAWPRWRGMDVKQSQTLLTRSFRG
jgi:hypothetical protein